MKLSKILNSGKFSLSFEVFPPKSDADYNSVSDAAEEIARLSPSFVSVTYGAGGGSRGLFTAKLARAIKSECGVETLAHLTCVASGKEEILAMIKEYKAAGIDNVFALRGDLPEGFSFPADRSYFHASDLAREIKSHGDFCVGGACYPEKHPESANKAEDIYYLKKKVDAGCDFLTTQMFFDNDLFYNFLYRLRDHGVTVPVLAGIMPITSAAQVKRIVKLSGSFLPQKIENLVDRFGGDGDAMKQAGIAYATEQIIDLYANGVKNVHVYTMNKPDVAKKITDNLCDIIGK